MSGTTIYGASDDLIEFEGDVHGEIDCYGNADAAQGVLLVCSDGTVLEVKYCGRVPGVWAISLLQAGVRFRAIDQCADPDAKPYSDQAHFYDGLKWVYFARRDWGKVR